MGVTLIVPDLFFSPSICQRISFAVRGIAYACTLALVGGTALADKPPQRVSDTDYGMAIYEYHQGNFFEALTRLKIASSEGGVSGHDDHPMLVEGGLMLAYGMTREAHKLFRTLLNESKVPKEARNQAWFYLGKLFWLEDDADASSDALEQVDGILLKSTDEALYQEWLYLKGHWLLRQHEAPEVGEGLDDILRALPDRSAWSWYLRYNRAVQSLDTGDIQVAVEGLSSLVEQAAPVQAPKPETAEELKALEQRTRLTLGQLHMASGNFSQAMAVLAVIPLNGLSSDQALFDYAIAASREGQYGLALQALHSLEKGSLFRPWLKQAPYARAFIIEQMSQPKAALDAYRKAAEQYQELDQSLAREQANLIENRLLEALRFIREGVKQQGSKGPSLGRPTILNDAYGRIQVLPRDFNLAELLAQEAFQLVLRDLHELYRLESSLDQWRTQLLSLDGMLATRRGTQDSHIGKTRQVWTGPDGDFADRIQRKREELAQVDEMLGVALDQTRQDLVILVESELARQRREIAGYLRASRHAQARLADRLFLEGANE